MGVNLNETGFAELWILVGKRCVYLIAKFVSFKGMTFIVCCVFLNTGIISGAVWCSMILGIITNRTGHAIMNNFGRTEEIDESENPPSDRKCSRKAGRRASSSKMKIGSIAKRAFTLFAHL